MPGESNEDVASMRSGDDCRVVKPVLTRTPLAENLDVPSAQGLHELVVVMGNVGRGEDLPHRPGCIRRDQLSLLEQKIEPKQLSHRGRMGMVCDRVAESFRTLAVMFANPETATASRVIKAEGIESLLDLAKPQLPRVFRGHLIAGSLDHQSQFVAGLRIQRGRCRRVAFKPGQKNAD